MVEVARYVQRRDRRLDGNLCRVFAAAYNVVATSAAGPLVEHAVHTPNPSGFLRMHQRLAHGRLRTSDCFRPSHVDWKVLTGASVLRQAQQRA